MKEWTAAIVDGGGGGVGVVDAVRQNGRGGVGGRKKRLSRFAWHSCPNHPPPAWTYDRMSILSTLNLSNTLRNTDHLNISNLYGFSHPPSGPIVTSIIRSPPPSPSFRKTTSGILVLIACHLSDPPRPLAAFVCR